MPESAEMIIAKGEDHLIGDEPGDEPGWICGAGVVPCSSCGDVADYLCDYPAGQGKTCDLPLCRACSRPISEAQDLCLIHHAEWMNKSGRKNLDAGLRLVEGADSGGEGGEG